MAAIEFIVTGRVQGVWFRASAQKVARRLGISGWIRNRTDGAVEGCAAGEADSLAAFRDWLGRGPVGAKVAEVETRPVDEPEQSEDFAVL